MSVLTPIDFCHAWAIFGPLVHKNTQKGELVKLPVSDIWGLSFIRIRSLPLKSFLDFFLNVLLYQLESWFIHWVGCTFYHDVGEISDLSQSEAPNLVMWRVKVIGIDHDTVCAGVVCAATPGTARVGRPSCGRLRPRRPAHECCAGSGSTNHDSADRMSGQFLFYHEKEAKHNDKSRDNHDDERHAESPWLTTPLWWWKRP